MLDPERKSGERKTVAREPDNVEAANDALSHFVIDARWLDRALLDRIECLADEVVVDDPCCRLVDDSFARVRVRAASGDARRAERRTEQWLPIERPQDESEPVKYFRSSEAVLATLVELVAAARTRWHIERDDRKLEGEFGPGHYEICGRRGLHQHVSLRPRATRHGEISYSDNPEMVSCECM